MKKTLSPIPSRFGKEYKPLVLHLTVYSTYQLTKKYLGYYLTASNSRGHGMHSPFVFDFILNVLQNGKNYQPPENIEALRKELLKNKTLLERKDLGAGSRQGIKVQTVAQLARLSLKQEKYARLLYRLVKHYQPSNIIELGTSLGITTCYLSKANEQARVMTVEGDPSVAAIAQENFLKLNCSNIDLFEGDFDDLLPHLLSQLSSPLGVAFIDGNHRYEPTVRYFAELLHASNEYSILVFDDIHWSAEMEAAWEEIKNHPSVRYTIDIFFLGFVFFRKDFKVRQNFQIRF
jgi:predicted O-methyltransferase YrrM